MSESPWTFGTESARTGGSDAVTLIEGPTFALSGRSGDIHTGGAAGLYLLDTRVLSRWTLTVDGHPVDALSVTHDGPFGATFVGRVNLDGGADASIVVMQRRYVGRGLREDLEIRNHGSARTEVPVVLTAEADFRHVFDVKAGHFVEIEPSITRATPNGIAIEPGDTTRSPVDRCEVATFPAPDVTGANGSAGSLEWRVDLGAGETWSCCMEVSVAAGDEHVEPSYRCGAEVHHAIPVARLRNWRHSASRISTDDPTLRAAVDRAVDDLGALRIFDPAHTDRTVVAAGAPWFMTLFGRDSLLTSWMSLLVDHDLALGVLQELADTQGEREDPRSDEQPGKILHEVRFDRLSARLLGGHGRYYGSIDATPLFVMLAAELTRWVGADDRIRSLLPAVDRAIEWIDRFGDRDGDGFIEYLRGDPAGLEHQGWKDSWDGIRHADGAVAAPPIALCEAQGYVYGALLARADLARSFGESAETRRTFLERADHFKAHFNDAFWSDRRGAYIVGLDAEKRPIESNASNIGHLLWTGIVPEARRRAVADLLVAPSMFSGWGLRTLASDAAGYNPLSYHCGSVWPHDTAIAVAGLAAACLDDAASVLAGGLLDASTHSGGRLPELFAGFARDDVGAPVPYPASCSPQAWSAAAPLLLVRAMLGLQPDAVAGRLLLRPRLAPGIDRLHVTGLPIGDATVDIRVEGADATVDVVGGSLDVNVR